MPGLTAPLLVQRAHLQQLLEHCRAALPEEACGLLSGAGNRVRRVWPATNADPDPRTGFRLAEAEQWHLFQAIAAAGDELVGIYHSHPTDVARPSRRDIEMAYYPQCAYVIVSFARRTPVVRAFRIVRERHLVVPVPLQVVED